MALVLLAMCRPSVRLMARCMTHSLEDTCVSSAVTNVVMVDQRKGATILSDLAALRRWGFVTGDYRGYSGTLHMLGYHLYLSGTPSEALTEVCPALIKDGCVHGYVMQYISEHGVAAGMHLCTSTTNERLHLGCMHALGHSYLEMHDMPLTDAVQDFCGQFQGMAYVACVSGLFHEHTKAGEGKGHAHYYERSHEYIELPCDKFSGPVYELCYGARGSFRQYYPHAESLEATYAACADAKTTEARAVCTAHADERVRISEGYSSVHE